MSGGCHESGGIAGAGLRPGMGALGAARAASPTRAWAADRVGGWLEMGRQGRRGRHSAPGSPGPHRAGGARGEQDGRRLGSRPGAGHMGAGPARGWAGRSTPGRAGLAPDARAQGAPGAGRTAAPGTSRSIPPEPCEAWGIPGHASGEVVSAPTKGSTPRPGARPRCWRRSGVGQTVHPMRLVERGSRTTRGPWQTMAAGRSQLVYATRASWVSGWVFMRASVSR